LPQVNPCRNSHLQDKTQSVENGIPTQSVGMRKNDFARTELAQSAIKNQKSNEEVSMSDVERLKNYINGAWCESAAATYADVQNPATAEVLARTPFSPPSEVDEAARAAARAFESWRQTPATQRIQPLFKLKAMMEESFEDLARTITVENGKVLDDARGEMRRAIENVEVACGIPMMMLGDFSEDIARGIDEYMRWWHRSAPSTFRG
jgi:delta 1-pyrroline-5-carboxylate dehydrogenase